MASKKKIKTSDLTNGERLRVLRRRRRETIKQAAAELCVSAQEYSRSEKDRGGSVKSSSLGNVGRLSDGEVAMILRIRGNWTLADISDEMGRCPWWLAKQERGDVPVTDELREYWGL